MKKLFIALALFPTLVFAWPWSTDMMNQPSIKPQEGVMTPFPKRSIPVTGIPTKVANREEAKPLTSPIPVSAGSLAKGKVLFKIYCAACHGLTGKADSPVSSKIGAISLVDSYVQETLTEGWVFGTITFGSYVMPAYGMPQGREDKRGSNDLSVEERWHVVNYVKHGLLQDAQSELTRTASSK
ncbi:MAG: c-type cytochrome [Gammaproteobacteria bacterium]